MGLYNDVMASVVCPNCRGTVEAAVQFKYGDLGRHYQMGDEVALARGARERPARVVVYGQAAGACPLCAYDDDWPIYVHIVDGRLASVQEPTGEHDFLSSQSLYLILEP